MYPSYAVVLDHGQNRLLLLRIKQLSFPNGETAAAVGVQAKFKQTNSGELYGTIKFLGSVTDCNAFIDHNQSPKSQINDYDHHHNNNNNHHQLTDISHNHSMTQYGSMTNLPDYSYYESRIEQLNGQIGELTTKNEHLEEEKANSELQNSQLEDEMNELMTEFNAQKEQLKQAQEEIALLKTSRVSQASGSDTAFEDQPPGTVAIFTEFKSMLTKIQTSVDSLSPLNVVVTGQSKKTVFLPPSNELEVDLEGYQHASCSQNARMFTRRMVALVFDFEEIFNGTVNGRQRGVKRQNDEDAEGYILSPWKIKMITDCTAHHFPNQMTRGQVQTVIGNQVAKLKSGDVSNMERRKWKGFTPEAYAEKLGKSVDSFKFTAREAKLSNKY